MSAAGVADAVIAHVEAGVDALIVANFANADMVGHTGDFDATVRAVECIDACIGRIARAVDAAHGGLLITADHGNAEYKIDRRDGSVLTAHTTSPVPVILCGAGDGTAARRWRAARHRADGARRDGTAGARRDDRDIAARALTLAGYGVGLGGANGTGSIWSTGCGPLVPSVGRDRVGSRHAPPVAASHVDRLRVDGDPVAPADGDGDA